ncbi:Gene model 648, (NCBI) [Apodemus speciosus]|uniref:Gene model 648, (NCBI) n=1 Tax=Apodemus speciosus TaxID=105296 RepID=A0ABQ0FU66_APOSI
MMAGEGRELSVCSEKEEDRAGEVVDSTLPKMRQIMNMEPMKKREREPHLKASVVVKGEGLLPEGSDATFTGGIVSSEIPPGVLSVAALTAGEGMSSGCTESHATFNADIKRQIMQEIRRFGRKYGRLFKILEEVQGPLEVRIQLVKFSIKEAARNLKDIT